MSTTIVERLKTALGDRDVPEGAREQLAQEMAPFVREVEVEVEYRAPHGGVMRQTETQLRVIDAAGNVRERFGRPLRVQEFVDECKYYRHQKNGNWLSVHGSQTFAFDS